MPPLTDGEQDVLSDLAADSQPDADDGPDDDDGYVPWPSLDQWYAMVEEHSVGKTCGMVPWTIREIQDYCDTYGHLPPHLATAAIGPAVADDEAGGF